VFSVILYAGANFIVLDDAGVMGGKEIFLAMFPMMFGAMSAGQAN